MRNPAWSLDEDRILSENYGLVSAVDLQARLPNRSLHAIYHRAQDLNLKGFVYRRYDHDRAFFENNPYRHYWAGFIAADGCIYLSGSNSVVILDLAFKDRDHVVQFRDDTLYNGPVRCRNAKGYKPGGYSHSRVDVCGAMEWIHSLASIYNITPKKSLTLQPPTGLSRKDALRFIVGLIDGDGSIFIDAGGRLHLSICGTSAMLEWIKGIFDDIASPVRGGSQIHPGRGQVFQLSFGQERAIRLCSTLWRLGNCRYLMRKWSKFLQVAYPEQLSTSQGEWTVLSTGGLAGGDASHRLC